MEEAKEAPIIPDEDELVNEEEVEEEQKEHGFGMIEINISWLKA